MATGLFGAQRRLPQIDPALAAQITQDRGIMPGDRPTPQMPQLPSAPQRKPGLFGQGGVGRAIAGTIGDVLLQRGGMAPIYGPTVQRQQMMAEQQRQASLQREQEWQDYLRKYEYELANPKPVNNDTVADYQFIRQNLGDEAANTFLKNRADPPQYRQGPDGQFYRVQTAEPPPETLPADFDFGGGGVGNGTGGFPR